MVNFPALSKGGGKAVGGPNTNKTPAPSGMVPMVYPSFSNLMQAVKQATKVFFCRKAALNVKSEVPRTQGDEAGTGGGMKSNEFGGKQTFAPSNKSAVLIEGADAVCATAQTQHNGANFNAPGVAVQPPPAQKVFVKKGK